MLLAGEPSGDMLAAELVTALRPRLTAADPVADFAMQPLRTALAPRFFGAGGPRMAAAGVELVCDLTRHSVIGVFEVLRKYTQFRRLFGDLLSLAADRQPDVIIGVDYGGFNLRFAHAVRALTRRRAGVFHNWRPRLVQFVSPQVWASRPGRAAQMAEDLDLLLSIFPFERAWYARHARQLRVEFVGHPLLDRYAAAAGGERVAASAANASVPPELLLLPGSRRAELQRHLPVMLAALALIRRKLPALAATVVLPDERLARQAAVCGSLPGVRVQVGSLGEALGRATVALSKTGTVTMECAYFYLPTVTLYRTSWSLYQVGKRVVTVPTLTMPNLLAGENLFPEFIQDAATPEALARATLELLLDASRRAVLQRKLRDVISSLGGPGAAARAADAIVRLLANSPQDRA
jgi:lipid-A-disaccharide synthase